MTTKDTKPLPLLSDEIIIETSDRIFEMPKGLDPEDEQEGDMIESILGDRLLIRRGMREARIIYESSRSSDLSRIAQLEGLVRELVTVGDAVVKRWDSPHWKDLPHTATFIHALRDSVAKASTRIPQDLVP